MYDFLLYALIGGILLSTMTAPLGALVVWRRMAYFGDTLAHGALLGVALGILMNLANPFWTIAAVSLVVALLLFGFERRKTMARDSILGILSHASLALGIIVIAFVPSFRGDLFGFLFGDILAIDMTDLWTLAGCAVAIGVMLKIFWQDWVLVTVDAELAQVEGVNVARAQIVFVVCLALLIAVAMKLLGVLLITAMLIIPAVAARPLSKSPERMVVMTFFISVLSVIIGLAASLGFDLPAGPAIVTASALLFGMSLWM